MECRSTKLVLYMLALVSLFKLVVSMPDLFLNLALVEYIEGTIGVGDDQIEHLDNSVFLLEKVLSINPSSKVYDFWGRVCLTQGKWDQALESWRKTDYSIEHFISVADSYEQSGCSRVLNIYDVLVNLAPNSGVPWYYRGLHLYRVGDYNEAVSSFKQAISTDNLGSQIGQSDVYFQIGEALRASGMAQKAYEAFVQSTQIDHFSRLAYEVNAFYKQGEMLVWMERYSDAREPLQRAIHVEPDFFSAYSLLGVVAYQQGDVAGAIQMWETAISIEPKYIWPYLHIARMYRDLGEFAKAKTYYRQVLSLEPQNRAALEELAELEE